MFEISSDSSFETGSNDRDAKIFSFGYSHGLMFENSKYTVGNEEYGCSKELLQEADMIINIPLRGVKNSLNVAQSFAVAAFSATKDLHLRTQKELYEIRRFS